MGIVNGVKDFLGFLFDTGKGFIQSAVKGTPDYIDNSSINKMFYKELKSNPNDIIEKYGTDYIKELNGKKIIPEFDKLSKTQQGEILSKYRKEMTSNIRDTNAFNALDYDNFDPGSQKHLESVYRTMNSDDFKNRYLQHQIELGESGMFGKKYSNFDFSDGGKNLTEAQRKSLQKEFDIQYDDRMSRFQALYSVDGGGPDIGPPQRLNYNKGLQTRYLESKQGKKQLDMLHGGLGKKNKSIIETAIEKNEEGKQAYEGYRSYLQNSLENTPEISNTNRWSAPDSFEKWATREGYSTDDVKELSKYLASGNPDHSGIDLWQKIKDHPRISTAIAVGTVWGVSEFAEEDSF